MTVFHKWRALLAAFLLVGALAPVSHARRPVPHRGPVSTSAARVHQGLGLPQTSPGEDPHAIVLLRREFTVVYYPEHKIPKLVSWVTRASDLQGEQEGKRRFHPEALLDGPKATRLDYSRIGGLGLTRGHMLRAGERTAAVANLETFSFINVVPQAEHSNAGPWLHLEEHYGAYVRQGYDAHVQSGIILEGKRQTIGDGVTVPSSTWKIVVLVPTGKDPTDVTVADVQAGRVRSYAVIVPNNNRDVDLNDSFAEYAVPIVEIAKRAKLTGLLSGLSEPVREELSKSPSVRAVGRGGYELNGELIMPTAPILPGKGSLNHLIVHKLLGLRLSPALQAAA